MTILSNHRLQSQNTIAFIEEAAREINNIAKYPMETLVNVLVKMTWPVNNAMISRMMNAKSVEDLIKRTKLFEEKVKPLNKKKCTAAFVRKMDMIPSHV